MEANQSKQSFYKDTTATKKIFGLRKRIRAVKGGTSASKTISILIWCIDYAQQERESPEIITIASESFPHLSLGAIRDFMNIMKDRGYWRDDRWNASKYFYTFETGTVIEFMSVDTYSKAHGPRRDVLFLNECNNLPWTIVDQLIIRTRKIVWMDWNPTEEFWFHTEMLPHRDDIDYITLTYKDNEALDEITIKEIESHKHNSQWWPVYGLGQDGVIETRIYSGWNTIDEIPPEARLVCKGLDFGYTNDPTALVDVYKWNGGLILDELLYQKGMINSEIVKAIGKDQPITIADSAEPKSITEIAMHSVTIIGAKKGKGSISQGIDSVRGRKIWVTKRSLHIWKEYRNYCWIKDKDGKILNEPNQIMDHTMDAIRYAVSFLYPIEEEEVSYPQPEEHELPGIGGARYNQNSNTPIPTLVAPLVDGKNRMQKILEKRKTLKENSTNYETDTPWQKPGI